jgi:IS30 family transposase
MKYRTRIYYTESQKALMWERWKEGWTLHQIGHLFDRAHTSVHKILAETGGFRPPQRRRNAKALTLAEREEVSRFLAEGWYRSLFIQARGALKKELLVHLRRTRGMRRSRHHTQKTDIHGKIVDAVSISERPGSAEDRAVPGHWEGDLFFGSHNSQIATLVERQTRYVMLVKVANKDTQTVVDALIKNARKLPQELYKSLTWDRGKELASHKRFTLATDIQVYFCDPRSPWQRGSNENTNGLLRQYMPKGIDISSYSQAKLNAVARQLNERPRKTLGYQTPAQKFDETVALTS